jgi:hypothetical protein
MYLCRTGQEKEAEHFQLSERFDLEPHQGAECDDGCGYRRSRSQRIAYPYSRNDKDYSSFDGLSIRRLYRLAKLAAGRQTGQLSSQQELSISYGHTIFHWSLA